MRSERQACPQWGAPRESISLWCFSLHSLHCFLQRIHSLDAAHSEGFIAQFKVNSCPRLVSVVCMGGGGVGISSACSLGSRVSYHLSFLNCSIPRNLFSLVPYSLFLVQKRNKSRMFLVPEPELLTTFRADTWCFLPWFLMSTKWGSWCAICSRGTYLFSACLLWEKSDHRALNLETNIARGQQLT